MQLRSYTDSDLEPVVLLFTAAVHSIADSDYTSAQRAAWAPEPPDLDEWRKRLSPLKTLVAEKSPAEPLATDQDRHSRLLGFISYETNGHIQFLYTSPKSMRRGIASALYSCVESELIALGVDELFTEASVVARPFFERQGFVVVEEQCVYRGRVAFRRYGMRKSTKPESSIG